MKTIKKSIRRRRLGKRDVIKKFRPTPANEQQPT